MITDVTSPRAMLRLSGAISGKRRSASLPRSAMSIMAIGISTAQMIIAAVIATIYVALVVPLGFYTASFLLMLALPMALGFRQLVYALIVALVFMVLIYLVFSVLLEKPLPREALLSLFAAGA